MIVLIEGGSGSGKSAFAEDRVMQLSDSQKHPLYYLATMKVYDEEGRKKVERHRVLRAGKGFQTVEKPEKIEEAAAEIGEDAVVLLECMSNLVANEMFSGESPRNSADVAETVLRGVRILSEKAKHLVIVTNNVFEDGIGYDETTAAYQEALGRVNEGIAAIASEVTEVVVGITVPVKREERQ